MSYKRLLEDQEKPALHLVIPLFWLRWGLLSILLCIALCLIPFCLPRQTSPQKVHLWDQELRPEYIDEPLGKSAVRYLDGYLIALAGLDDKATFQANVDRVLSPDVIFESVSWGPGGSSLMTHGRDEWSNSGEEKQFRKAFGSTELFTQMIFLGDDRHATTTSYGTLHWTGELFGIQSPNKWIELRVCDFYNVTRDPHGARGGLITYNFMMIDWADVVYRAGLPGLPPAVLEDGVVLPPSANDGVPAPFSILAKSQDVMTARSVMNDILKDDWVGSGSGQRWWHQNMTFYGPRGVGLASNASAFRDHVLKPFHAAFANRSLESEILTCEGDYCGAMGHIEGVHVGNWLGLSPSFKQVKIRYGMHCRFVAGKAKEGWAIFDVPGLFNQLGFDFFKTAAHGFSQPILLQKRHSLSFV